MTTFDGAAPGAAFTFTGHEPFFDVVHGVPVATTGEDGEALLALGHLDARATLAVTATYYRRSYGQRILPTSAVTQMLHDTRHAWIHPRTTDPDTNWRWAEAPAGDDQAQAVTFIAAEWLDYEDDTVASPCPACGRRSRSSTIADGPGRAGFGRYHTCRHCHHRWPAAPASHPRLEHEQKWPATHDGCCFACGCGHMFPCQTTCTIAKHDPVIGQPLCTACRAQLSPRTWQQLVAVAYGTATTSDAHDEQRDRWLVAEALRGIPPAHAAHDWIRRVAHACRARAAQRAQHR